MRERVFDPPQNDGSLLYPSKGKTMKPIISVEHLSKYYKINHQKRGGDTFVESATVLGRGVVERMFHPFRPRRTKEKIEEFHALDDLSFEIEAGDRVGILGRNGAGKSTLFKLLSRITEPTKGCIKILNVIAVRENGKVHVTLDANRPLNEHITLVLLGENDRLARVKP